VQLAAVDFVDGVGILGEVGGSNSVVREISDPSELASRLTLAGTVISTPEAHSSFAEAADTSHWQIAPRLAAISQYFSDRLGDAPHLVIWMEARRTIIGLVTREGVEREREILDGPLALQPFLWKRCVQTVPSLAAWLRAYGDKSSEQKAFGAFLANLRDGSGSRTVGGAKWMKPEFTLPAGPVSDAFRRFRRSVDPKNTAQHLVLAGWASAAHWNLGDIVAQDGLGVLSANRSQAFQEAVRGMLLSHSDLISATARKLNVLQEPKPLSDMPATSIATASKASGARNGSPALDKGISSPLGEEIGGSGPQHDVTPDASKAHQSRGGKVPRMATIVVGLLALIALSFLLRMWVTNPTPLSDLTSDGEIRKISVTADGKTAITVSGQDDRNVLHFYRIADWQDQSQTVVSATPIAISPDGKLVGAPGSRGVPVLLDVESGSVRREMGPQSEAHRGKITVLAFSQGGRMLLSGSDTGEIRLWDTATGLHLQSHQLTAPIGAVAVWSDALIGAAAGNSLFVWQSPTKAREMDADATVHSLAFAQEGTMLAVGTTREVLLWDLNGSDRARMNVPGKVEDLAFSPDSTRLAVAVENDVLVFPVQNGKLGRPETRHGHTAPVTTVVFLPQQQPLVLLSGSRDKTVKVWKFH